jgi:hypothetical protein
MKRDHVFLDPYACREPTPEQIEAAIRRAHHERSVVVHDYLRRARSRIVGWFGANTGARVSRTCAHGA